ncbi:hypothetical protein LMG29542_02781 [Paraburkholderia humisilvae]|uniref:Uncharacterized protein n=1 Tax=Paraburkholderia humisilvae TaxID=627669 RepID=A0A6J5DT67_9BURK|nr:hypothetical protein LMG29542_02781 [Paraburkholderia humisilvae]
MEVHHYDYCAVANAPHWAAAYQAAVGLRVSAKVSALRSATLSAMESARLSHSEEVAL